MGLIAWIQRAFSPAKLTNGSPVVGSRALWEQFGRIGGGITPDDVSRIIRRADSGQPSTFVDLTNESQQKDSHFQSVVSTRERAVALVDLGFIEPKDATDQEREAVDLCHRLVDDFKNWPTLIEHLTGSFRFGHATAETPWEKTPDGLILPNRAQVVPTRDFIFAQTDGALRYRKTIFDTVGVDLLGDNPGRIVQIERRITGDVLAREGLARVLVWSALLRNWSLRDWIALGEIAWKPWRTAAYKSGTNQADIDALVDALERIGSTGVGAFPEEVNLSVEWPKGVTGSTSSHRELFETLGREMSKAVLGTTTSVESGPHGTKGDTATRDEIRSDIRESDARAVAACLRYQLFAPAVAVNIGANVRCPCPWFETEETANQKEFAEALKNLSDAGLRVPAKWARDQLGMPEPEEGEEVVEPKASAQVPAQLEGKAPPPPGDEPPPNPDEPPAKDAKAKALDENGNELPSEGRDYTDDVETSTKKVAARELALTIASVVSAVQNAGSYQEAKTAILEKYRGMAPPRELARLLEGALLMTEAAGTLAVNEETPELTGGK